MAISQLRQLGHWATGLPDAPAPPLWAGCHQVRPPNRRSSKGRLINAVERPISTKSTVAPQYRPQLALATKEIGLVQRRSPGPSPKARQAAWRAPVALLKATAWGDRKHQRELFRTPAPGPCVRKSPRKQSSTAFSSAGDGLPPVGQPCLLAHRNQRPCQYLVMARL